MADFADCAASRTSFVDPLSSGVKTENREVVFCLPPPPTPVLAVIDAGLGGIKSSKPTTW